MRRLLIFMRFWVLLALVTIASAQTTAPAAAAPPATEPFTLETLFSQRDLKALEQLVTTAQANSPAVTEAEGALSLNTAETELLGRLGRSLEVGVGADLAMDYYSQASPTYNISLSLDVVELLSADDKQTVLSGRVIEARALTRLAVVEAFTRLVVARNNAESAAQALETSEAQFRAVGSLLKVGEATFNDQLAARSSVSNAAVALLTANAEVIVALEALAVVVGIDAKEVAAVLVQEGKP